MRRKYLGLVATFIFMTVSLTSAHADDESYSLCKFQKEVRTLRIQKETGKCLTIYNKNGKDQSVGEAQYESSCESILGRVRANLENAGWKCKAVQNSGTAELSEVR